MEMTIAKAMKHKNRVGARINQVQNDISRNNSILATNKRSYEVTLLLKDLEVLVEHQILVKSKIDHSSAPMRPALIRMAELRSRAAFLRGISTIDGKQPASSWRNEEMHEYKATLLQPDVDAMVRETETKLDKLQDELDAFNATNKITVEVPVAFAGPTKS